MEDFLQDFPSTRPNFLWLVDSDTIRTAAIGLKRERGPPNNLLLGHIDRLIDFDIAEIMPRVKDRLFSGAFCVPKKVPGTLRFIINPKSLNNSLSNAAIPKCTLPSYRSIRLTMMSHEWVVQFDFKSFYYQFLLPEKVRNLFGFRVGNKLYRMRRAPMGYVYTSGWTMFC